MSVQNLRTIRAMGKQASKSLHVNVVQYIIHFNTYELVLLQWFFSWDGVSFPATKRGLNVLQMKKILGS